MTVMVFTEQYSAIAFSSRVHSSSVRQPFAFWMSSTKPAGEIAVPVALLSDFATPAACLSVRAAGAHNENILGVISLAGGVYVLYLAVETFRIRGFELPDETVAPRSLMKGVMTNFLSPSPYLFWTTVGTSMISRSWKNGALAPAVFVLSFLFVLVTSKMTLAFIAGRSRGFLSGNGYVLTMRILSLALAFFSLMLLNDGLVKLLTCC